jgi:hypothetical protein
MKDTCLAVVPFVRRKDASAELLSRLRRECPLYMSVHFVCVSRDTSFLLCPYSCPDLQMFCKL